MLRIRLDLHVGHIGGEVQKNILSILLCAPVVAVEQHFLVIPKRLVASQELMIRKNIVQCVSKELNPLKFDLSASCCINLTAPNASN